MRFTGLAVVDLMLYCLAALARATSRLRIGSMVFLRLIDTRVAFPALPVAYQVTGVSGGDPEGVSRVTLRRLGHRRSEDRESLPPSEMADTF